MEDEKKTAKLILDDDYTYICSNCGESVLKGLDIGIAPTKEYIELRWKYCNMCGAKIITVEVG